MNDKPDLILFVDDQAGARKYFSAMFSSDYEVLTAENANEAWALIETHSDCLALVISDQRMPKRTGVDLLSALRQRHPRIMRMLTTAYTDLDVAIDAVNRGDIYSYVNKPWNIEELSLDIRRAVELFHLQHERDVLLDTHGTKLRNALSADKLRTYGIIAATCSCWVDRPLSATLAFWSDTMRYFKHHSQRQDSINVDAMEHARVAIADQTRVIMNQASELGIWLSHCQNAPQVHEIDSQELLASISEQCQYYHCEKSQATETLRIDARLLRAGLCAFAEYLVLRSALDKKQVTIHLGAMNALTGGIDFKITVYCADTAETKDLVDITVVECLGLRAYLAIHHYGGNISVCEWTMTSGIININVPQPTTPRCRETFETFQTEFLANW